MVRTFADRRMDATSTEDISIGGGWILPGLGQDSAFIRHILANPLLADYPLAILDCDYALSPEYPCPADTEDARDVIEYVLSRPEKYDASRLTLGGFSTGGTIALGLSAAMGKEKKEDKEEWDTYEHPIKAVFTVYPEVTWLGDRDVVEVPRKTKKGLAGFVLPLWFSRYITDAHFFCPIRNSGISKAQEMRRKEELASRPIVSPLNGEMRDFSPLIVMYTAQYDHLRRDAEKLRDRFARDKGIRLHGRRIDGVGHGWDQLVKKNQVGYIEKDEIYDMAARMIATVGGLEVFMK